MIAVEFDDKVVSTGTASAISQTCLEQGLMVMTTSVFETLRLMPPLNVSEKDTALALDIFKDSMEKQLQMQF